MSERSFRCARHVRFAPRQVLVLAWLWSSAAWGGCAEDPWFEPPPATVPHPLAGVQVRCGVAPGAASQRAQALEATADARFERVPFELGEATAAAIAVREAEACYRLAADREGRLRAEAKRSRIEEELVHRFERAELALAVARRDEDAGAVVREARRLAALTSRAGPSMAAYRTWLSEVERVARAELSEAEHRRGEER